MAINKYQSNWLCNHGNETFNLLVLYTHVENKMVAIDPCVKGASYHYRHSSSFMITLFSHDAQGGVYKQSWRRYPDWN